MMLPENVNKYLNKYGLQKRKLIFSPGMQFNNAVVIPAIAEYENIKKLLISLAENNTKYFKSALFIFVINNLASSDNKIKENNRDSLELLQSIIDKRENDFSKKIISSGIQVGYVDASSERNELPEKDGGVGLARKIGMDIALQHFDYSAKEKKILICLDADCTVSTNYLCDIIEQFNTRNISSASIYFEHTIPADEEEAKAIICYEIFLRYYVAGLKYAGSPYAFHTIGSAMACDYGSYINVEGMNKRKAAEDFYFLEKLAKNFEINSINTTAVYPSPRGSWRVPFGTGQRVNRFLSSIQDEYLLYNPYSFEILKQWLKAYNALDDTNEILSAAEKIEPALLSFLKPQKLEESWNKILYHTKNRDQLLLQKKKWFDGFRTLKLIHYLRDNGYPLLNMFDAIDKLMKINFRDKDEKTPPLEIQKKYLDYFRKRMTDD